MLLIEMTQKKIIQLFQNQSDLSWHLHHLLYDSEATLKDYTQVKLSWLVSA